MKLNQAKSTIVDTNITNMGNFTVSNSPHLFSLLTANLYENPTKAVIRELSCNAYDAHVMAGIPDKPFKVQLPTRFDPNFKVVDFGPGLSEEQVYSLYTCLGGSNKQGSNDYIGGFGLGCKSPFAVTDTYTVESRNDALAKTYLLSRDGGVPKVAKVSERPLAADESTGLTVTVVLNNPNQRQWQDEALSVFNWFKVKPEINLSEGVKYPIDIVRETDKCMFTRGNFHSWSLHVLVGNVLYCVPDEKLRVAYSMSNIVVKAPIGSVTIAPSRETLVLDTTTKQTLLSLCQDIVSTEVKHVQEYINLNCSTLDTATIMANFMFNEQNLPKDWLKALSFIDRVKGTPHRISTDINYLADVPRLSHRLYRKDYSKTWINKSSFKYDATNKKVYQGEAIPKGLNHSFEYTNNHYVINDLGDIREAELKRRLENLDTTKSSVCIILSQQDFDEQMKALSVGVDGVQPKHVGFNPVLLSTMPEIFPDDEVANTTAPTGGPRAVSAKKESIKDYIHVLTPANATKLRGTHRSSGYYTDTIRSFGELGTLEPVKGDKEIRYFVANNWRNLQRSDMEAAANFVVHLGLPLYFLMATAVKEIESDPVGYANWVEVELNNGEQLTELVLSTIPPDEQFSVLEHVKFTNLPRFGVRDSHIVLYHHVYDTYDKLMTKHMTKRNYLRYSMSATMKAKIVNPMQDIAEIVHDKYHPLMGDVIGNNKVLSAEIYNWYWETKLNKK